MLVASVPLSRGSIRRNSPHAIQITKREGEMGQQKERCMLQCSLKMYQWYRCKIMQKIDDGKSHVQYLDYVATLRKQHISQAWCALLRSLPSSLWSFFCGFHGLQSLKRDNHRAFYDKVMFCCFYGWESLKKDDDPALYDKGGYRWRLYGRKAHGEAATPCYKFASCFPRRLKIPKSKMKLQRHRKPCAVCLWV
nr:uncharacterized protein LOC119178475 isoform X1 [Rhipicephalus microplus]